MTSLLTRMSRLFSRRRGEILARKAAPPSLRRNHKIRDPLLEQRARESVEVIAPELSDRLRVGWNLRMRTTAGVAIIGRWEVWLNPSLKAISVEEIERTLLHELAHLVAAHRHPRRRLAPHGVEWRQACGDLGIAGEGRTHHLPFQVHRMKRRYRLQCPVCGASHQRVRAPKSRVACLSCCRRHHGGLYHERFRLEVVKLS